MMRLELKVGILSYEDMKARTIAIARGELRPSPDEPKVWFTSVESFVKFMSEGNLEAFERIQIRDYVMKLSDFKIGMEFTTASGKKWRCTDIGTRVIVCISLDPHEIVKSAKNQDGTYSKTSEITSNPSWHEGPPYPILEYVLDEYDLETCKPI